MQVIQVILVKYPYGEGTTDDPVRQISAYYSTEGDMLVEIDPDGQVFVGGVTTRRFVQEPSVPA